MKKTFILFCIFVGSFFLFTKMHSADTKVETISNPMQHIVVATSTLTPIPVSLPATISIPAIGVNASIEAVGMDAEGRMGVPENNVDTAWYKYGYKPGEKGSAVIDGHFDTQTGAPAVFYKLSRLQNGDTITVTDTMSHTYTFVITAVTSYPFDSLPMQQIFASTDKTRLNLITCDGTWNREEHNYSNRVVIYSELESSN